MRTIRLRKATGSSAETRTAPAPRLGMAWRGVARDGNVEERWTMPQPTESPEGASSRPLQQVRAAVQLLQAAGITPITRPRALAAARARGTPIALRDWYRGAWELEASGSYRRRGNGESEWLEPAGATDFRRPGALRQTSASADQDELRALLGGDRAWLAGALRAELERLHDSDALFALAEALLELDPIEAERCLRAVSENDPRNIEALTALARVRAQRDELPGARALIEQVLRMAPENADAHVLLANILDDQQQRAEARRHYERAIELNPGSVTAHYNFGVLLVREGEREAAEAQLRQACELNPDDPTMLLTLAIVDMDNDQLVEAGKLLRRALALDEHNARAHRQYGVLLARQRDFSGAERELRAAVALDELGQHEEAERLFREACVNDPSRAEAYFQWMLQHEPDHVATLINLALLYMNDRRWSDAEALLRRAIEREPTQEQALRLYGIVLAELGQAARAEGVLRRALELNPDDESAETRLVALLWAEKRRDEAFALRRARLERAPESARAHVLLAQLYDNADQDEED